MNDRIPIEPKKVARVTFTHGCPKCKATVPFMTYALPGETSTRESTCAKCGTVTEFSLAVDENGVPDKCGIKVLSVREGEPGRPANVLQKPERAAGDLTIPRLDVEKLKAREFKPSHHADPEVIALADAFHAVCKQGDDEATAAGVWEAATAKARIQALFAYAGEGVKTGPSIIMQAHHALEAEGRWKENGNE